MKLPAYARDLIAYQRAGKNVEWLIISLDWTLGKALPRVVVPDDVRVDDLDLGFVNGIECMVAYRTDTRRAFDVAELALRNGAAKCGVFNRDTATMITTDEVRAIRGIQ